MTARRDARIVHVMVANKFLPPFIRLVRAMEPGGNRHTFWVAGDAEAYGIEPASDVVVRQQVGNDPYYRGLAGAIGGPGRIILHGLWDHQVNRILSRRLWRLPDCWWMIWGADLYDYVNAPRTRLWYRQELYRGLVIPGIGHLVTYVPGDVELARRWYGARGEYHECLLYPSNVVRPGSPTRSASRDPGPGTLHVQVGNSADPTNEHVEILERLAEIGPLDMRVHVPLSYGSPAHAAMVVRAGERLLGDRFIPMMQFLDPTAYMAHLGRIDVAIFNHRRQQAMGNIIQLAAMGKKVILRSSVTSWRFLRDLGVRVFDVESLDLRRLSPEDATRNASTLASWCSEERLREQLAGMFGESASSLSVPGKGSRWR